MATTMAASASSADKINCQCLSQMPKNLYGEHVSTAHIHKIFNYVYEIGCICLANVQRFIILVQLEALHTLGCTSVLYISFASIQLLKVLFHVWPLTKGADHRERERDTASHVHTYVHNFCIKWNRDKNFCPLQPSLSCMPCSISICRWSSHTIDTQYLFVRRKIDRYLSCFVYCINERKEREKKIARVLRNTLDLTQVIIPSKNFEGLKKRNALLFS